MSPSPIKILAGGALYQRKPRQDPTIDPQNIESSPRQEYIVTEDILKKLYFRLWEISK